MAVTAPVLWHTCGVLATQHLLIVEGHGHHEGGRKGAAGLGALETATLHGMCGKAWHLRTERKPFVTIVAARRSAVLLCVDPWLPVFVSTYNLAAHAVRVRHERRNVRFRKSRSRESQAAIQ